MEEGIKQKNVQEEQEQNKQKKKAELFLWDFIFSWPWMSLSSPLGTGGKRPGREADHPPPASAEVKNGGTIPPLPHKSSWRGT
jgi:hypothetical protein